MPETGPAIDEEEEQPKAKDRRRREAEEPTTPSEAPAAAEEPWGVSDPGGGTFTRFEQQPRGQAWSSYDDDNF